MSRSERDKGTRGEQEVRRMFEQAGFTDAVRTPNSGGLHIPGDITGIDGVHVEVKRQERLELPRWLRQAEEERSPGEVPVVAHRRNNERWYATLPLLDLCYLMAKARRT